MAKRLQALDLQLVTGRATIYPVVASLLSAPLNRMQQGSPVNADKAPTLLRFLESRSSWSAEVLGRVEQTLPRLRALGVADLSSVERRLGGDRVAFNGAFSEMVIAETLLEWGFDVLEFEPRGAGSRRVDLLIGLGDERLYIEVTCLRHPQHDWTVHAKDRLVQGLVRVPSGLVVDVRSYQPGHLQQTLNEIDAVVRDFEKAVAALDPGAPLPSVLVPSTPQQPIEIKTRGRDPELTKSTEVHWSSSRNDDTDADTPRLVDAIRDERRHLPSDHASAIIVDLSSWPSFQPHHLAIAQQMLAAHTMPAFVGACRARPLPVAPLDRVVLAADAAWISSPLGSALTSRW